MRLGGRGLFIMAEVAKSLAQQLASKQIDGFLRDYQLAASQQSFQPPAELEKAHSKWSAVRQSVDGLLTGMPVPSKQWLVHSMPSHQMTAAANRSGGQL
jgi:hypothetical protein